MSLRRLAASCLVFALVATAPAGAQSLRDLRSQDREDRALDREAAYTSEVCGRTIEASIDWASAASWPPRESLVEACDGALGAVETICRAGKTSVVRRFVCAGDQSGASLSSGVLRYGARPGGNGYAQTLAVIGGAQ